METTEETYVSYVVDTIPSHEIVFRKNVFPSFSGGSLAGPRFSPKKRVPLFFEEDNDGCELIGQIRSAIDVVHHESGDPPERVLVGRFTYLELMAHCERHLARSRAHCVHRDAESGTLMIYQTRIDPCIPIFFGHEHFFAAIPRLDFLMAEGELPGSSLVGRE